MKKMFLAVMLFAISATSSVHANKYEGILERLKSPTITCEQVKKNAALFEQQKAVATTNNLSEQSDASLAGVQTNKVQLGVDGSNQPIYLAYLSVGDINFNRGTIVCADDLFGYGGFRLQAQLWAAQGFYVVAFDGLGVGLSSYNVPTAMDGIGGYTGYSYQQLAYLFHEALITLGVNKNSAKTPITFVGCDFYGAVGFVYAYQYQNDPYALSFYVGDNTSFGQISSSNPCSIAVLNPTVAAEVAALYASAPCSTLCALNSGEFNQPGLPGDFTEIDCPNWGNYALNVSVNYGSTMPASVFTRQIVDSLQFDTSPLMAQVQIPVLIIFGGIFQLPVNKQTALLPLYGICYACQTGCNCASSTYYQPSPNSIALCYQNAGISCHTSRTERFNQDVLGFITGTAGFCDPYYGIITSTNANCPPNPSCSSNP